MSETIDDWQRTGRTEWRDQGAHHISWVEWKNRVTGENMMIPNMVHPEQSILWRKQREGSK